MDHPLRTHRTHRTRATPRPMCDTQRDDGTCAYHTSALLTCFHLSMAIELDSPRADRSSSPSSEPSRLVASSSGDRSPSSSMSLRRAVLMTDGVRCSSGSGGAGTSVGGGDVARELDPSTENDIGTSESRPAMAGGGDGEVVTSPDDCGGGGGLVEGEKDDVGGRGSGTDEGEVDAAPSPADHEGPASLGRAAIRQRKSKETRARSGQRKERKGRGREGWREC